MNLLSNDAAEAKKLLSIRSKIEAIDSKLAKVERARLPRDEIEQRVRTELAEFAGTADGGLGELAYTQRHDRLAPNLVADVLNNPRGIVAILGELLVPAIVDAAEANSGDESALSAEQRKEQINKLAADRIKLEREEEREILKLEAAGWVVGRRRDIDVAAMLDVWAEDLTDADAD